MDKKELITEDVIDIPSNRDYLFEEYLQEEQAEWNNYVRPEEYYNVLDQGSTSMCTLYALQAIINWNQILEDLKEIGNVVREQYDPKNDWIDNIRHLQTRIEKARKDWKIEWYLSIPRVWTNTPTWVMTIERRNKELKMALNKWYFIYTGTEYSKWTMNQSPLLNLWKDKYTWHAFSIVGADNIYQSHDRLYKFVNSWWKEWWDDWYWYIKEEDIDKLFTCYVVIPKSNAEFFRKYRANKKVMELISLAKQIYNENKDNKQIREYFEMIQLSNNLIKLFKI